VPRRSRAIGAAATYPCSLATCTSATCTFTNTAALRTLETLRTSWGHARQVASYARPGSAGSPRREGPLLAFTSFSGHVAPPQNFRNPHPRLRRSPLSVRISASVSPRDVSTITHPFPAPAAVRCGPGTSRDRGRRAGRGRSSSCTRQTLSKWLHGTRTACEAKCDASWLTVGSSPATMQLVHRLCEDQAPPGAERRGRTVAFWAPRLEAVQTYETGTLTDMDGLYHGRTRASSRWASSRWASTR
jgi:hypothetical protein